MCVSVFDACHRLTNSLVEDGKCAIEKWEDQEVEVCLSSVNLNIFACQRAHCLLTVRHGSSVEEQLSWLDSNGKHKVRLVTKQ